MNGEDEDWNDDGVDVSQPHKRRVQLVEILLVDVVDKPLTTRLRGSAVGC